MAPVGDPCLWYCFGIADREMNILYDLENQIPITDVPNSGIPGIKAQLSNALDF